MSKGETTRQRIIETSAALFNRRGYAGCSMSDIMKATGLEKGGIYQHFQTKESLAVEAVRFALSTVVEVRTSDLASIPSVFAKLRRIVERFISSPSPIVGGCPLMNTAVDADDGNPSLRKLAKRGFADWRRKLADTVREGIARGEFRSGTQPEQIADMMIASLEGALVMSRALHDNSPLENVGKALETMLSDIRLPARD